MWAGPDTKRVKAMKLLLLAAAAWWTSLVRAVVLQSPVAVDLHEFASTAAAASEEARLDGRNREQQQQRLSLRHLEAMWHTSLGVELDASSSGREEVFRATVDSQWALLASKDEDEPQHHSSLSLQGDGNGDDVLPGRETIASAASNPPIRSPFLVCGDRHPDAILALESVVHRARTQLAYSRGDTACLLAGLRLDEVETVRLSKGVHAIEPLPQPAKLSRSLHAKIEDPLESSSGRGSERRDTKGGGGARQQRRARPLGSIRFNHGEGLPSDLDVSLTPGVWGVDLVNAWAEHLTSFETTAHLWDEHLRQRFMWTRRPAAYGGEAAAGRPDKGAGDDERKKRGLAVNDGTRPSSVPGIRRARNTLVETHGLEDLERLWEQTAEHGRKDEGCDFGRLRTSSASARSNVDSNTNGFGGKSRSRHERARSNSRSGSSRKGFASTRDGRGDDHDRVVLRGVGSLGITPQDNAHCLLTVLAYLVTRPEVSYLDELPQVFELNVEAAWITQSGEETAYSIWNQGIDGRTEIITMADSGLDVNSCFFSEDQSEDNIECSTYTNPVFDLTKRKVVQYVGFVDCEDTENGHGTHVAGSAAGGMSRASAGDHFGDGSGFGARLAVFDFGDDEGNLVTPTNIQTQMLQPPYDIGARISTNSWGAVRTSYTSLDRQMDNFAYLKPDMVVVVAAGNCGDVISGCEYQGASISGAGSILSPALAKNVVTVGASEASPSSAGLADNVDEVAYFSSQGPTSDDNRIKPDVVAPGYHIFSASARPGEEASCEIGPMAGTSMATPVVAGVAAMIRQYFVQGWYPSGIATPSDMFNPSNALVKAMIVSSGTAMASYDGSAGSTILGSPPDGFQGFGRVLLDSVLNVRGSVDLFVEDAIDMAHGEVHSYFVDMDGVSSSAFDGDMKVAMVWMEPAGYSASVAPVYNDLDLLVIAFDGTSERTFYPNNLAEKDPDNTVEMIVIPDVDSYEWFNVTVTGASVTTPSLPYYALVVTGGKAVAYSPTASSSPGRTWFIRWEMDIEGIPVTQTATEAFEAGLAEAISLETGDYTNETSTMLVKIDHPAAADSVDSSTITVEIVVASEADGYAVLTYVLSAVEGSSSGGGGGGGGSSTGAGGEAGVSLTSALNEALQGRTTTNCLCVAVPLSDDGGGGGYDCSACEEGAVFSTVRSVTTSHGRYDLLSADRDSGRSPVSVFDSVNSSGDDDMFWGDFAGGRAIRGIIRSDSYFDMAGVVVAVVFFTSLGLFSLRRCPAADDEVRRRLSSTLGGRGNIGDLTVSPRGSKMGLSGADALGVSGRKQARGSRTSEFAGSGSPGTFTPGATPAP